MILIEITNNDLLEFDKQEMTVGLEVNTRR